MNEDTISRQAAIDAIYETFCYAYCDNCEKEMNEDLCGDCHRKYQNWAASKKIISKTINSLPSAGRQGHWIPVTERLPKLYTDVLLSVRQSYAFGEPDNWCVVGELIDKADITWATNYGFHDLLCSNGVKHTVWVSAWMPLPTPYKGGEEE